MNETNVNKCFKICSYLTKFDFWLFRAQSTQIQANLSLPEASPDTVTYQTVKRGAR